MTKIDTKIIENDGQGEKNPLKLTEYVLELNSNFNMDANIKTDDEFPIRLISSEDNAKRIERLTSSFNPL